MLQDAVNERVARIRAKNNERNGLESELLDLAEQGVEGRKQQPDLVKQLARVNYDLKHEWAQLAAVVGKVHRGGNE